MYTLCKKLVGKNFNNFSWLNFLTDFSISSSSAYASIFNILYIYSKYLSFHILYFLKSYIEPPISYVSPKDN